jgi:hypothetical protein
MEKIGKNPSQTQFTENEMDIINRITITVAILFDSFIRNHKELMRMIEPFSKTGLHDNDKDLARLGLTLNLRKMSHREEGMFPNQINQELARVLLKSSEKVFLQNESTLSKVLREFEDAHIFFRIKGKKEIKQKSPKSIRRKPKAGEARREGYPLVHSVTSTIKDYERILSSPNAVSLINSKLLKYGKLGEVYELLSKDAFDVFKEADLGFYNLLPVFGEIFPEINTDSMPNPQQFQEAIKSVGQDSLDQLKGIC